MDCSPPGSSVHGISQARIVEWVAIFLSRQSSKPMNWTQVCCITGVLLHCRRILYQLSYKGNPGSHSLQISHSVIFKSLWPHGLQHARLPCPSPIPRACSNSCPLSWWCHPTISSSVVPFSSCLQSFPASGSFPMNQFFTTGGQSNGASASASVLPMNIQDWFPVGLTGLISLQSKGLSRALQHSSSKASIFWCSAFLIVQISCSYMTSGKTIALNRQTFVSKAMSLLFNMLSRFLIAFLPRSKCLFISRLQLPSAVVYFLGFFRTQENKICHCFHCFPIYLPWSDGTGFPDLSFLNVEF